MLLPTIVCLPPVLGCLFMFCRVHLFLHEGTSLLSLFLGLHSNFQHYQWVFISEMLFIGYCQCEVIVSCADDITSQLAVSFH